jgi:hypothetical protein|tara:strand:- start:875 stop:1006 length:132 start_codon:yes stop_codon:yes gene_type:complete
MNEEDIYKFIYDHDWNDTTLVGELDDNDMNLLEGDYDDECNDD